MTIIESSFLWLRGITGDPAVTTVIWVAAALVCRFGPTRLGGCSVAGLNNQSTQPQRKLQRVLVFGLLGLFLYPATMGLSVWDPYRLGYSPGLLLALIAALTLLFWWWRNYLGMLMLTLATLAFALEFKESTNYWDYLLDPFMVIYCWAVWLRYGFGKTYNARFRAGRGPKQKAV
jgi:hypothetical protein